MPTYEYRCNQCGRPVTLFYKTYREYDAAAPVCPHCQSTQLTRLISRVAIARQGRDFSRMSAGEMLNVLEGGNSTEVGQMFKQLGQDDASLGDTYHSATERLLKGEAVEKIERDLSEAAASQPPSAPA